MFPSYNNHHFFDLGAYNRMKSQVLNGQSNQEDGASSSHTTNPPHYSNHTDDSRQETRPPVRRSAIELALRRSRSPEPHMHQQHVVDAHGFPFGWSAPSQPQIWSQIAGHRERGSSNQQESTPSSNPEPRTWPYATLYPAPGDEFAFRRSWSPEPHMHQQHVVDAHGFPSDWSAPSQPHVRSQIARRRESGPSNQQEETSPSIPSVKADNPQYRPQGYHPPSPPVRAASLDTERVGGHHGTAGTCSIRIVNGLDSYGHMIACIAMVAKVSYEEAKQAAIDTFAGYDPDEVAMNFKEAKKVIKKLGLTYERRFDKVTDWKDLPDLAIVMAIEQNRYGPVVYFHPVVFVRENGKEFICDSSNKEPVSPKDYPRKIDSDRSYIRIISQSHDGSGSSHLGEHSHYLKSKNRGGGISRKLLNLFKNFSA